MNADAVNIFGTAYTYTVAEGIAHCDKFHFFIIIDAFSYVYLVYERPLGTTAEA